MKRALQHAQGDIIVTMDADGEHKPKEPPDLIKPLFNGIHIVAGSRFLGSITVKSLRNGFNFKETPISVERRKHNFSKLKLLSGN